MQSIKVYDDKEQQRLEAHGRSGERYGGTGGTYATPRIQDYGMTSHPPEGSQGVTVSDGNPDKAMIHGMEHPKYRPKNLEEGEVKVYDRWSHFQYLQEQQWYWKVGPCEMWFKESGEIKLKVGGAIILMQSDGGVVHLNP